jgi:hypothetical protein
VRLRTLAAEEFHASIFATLRSARKLHAGGFAHLGDLQTAPLKLRSRGPSVSPKVRNRIALRTLEFFTLLLKTQMAATQFMMTPEEPVVWKWFMAKRQTPAAQGGRGRQPQSKIDGPLTRACPG